MKKLLLLCVLCLCAPIAFSQILEFNDISKRDFNGVMSIRDQKENVMGYYTYYELEKEGKGMRLYEFAFADKQLGGIKKYSLSIHKRAEINNVVFNDKYLLISYDDIKNKKLVFTTVNTQGEQVGYNEFEVDKRKNVTGDFYPSAGDGFYLVKPNIVKGRTGYILQKYDNGLKVVWTQEVIPEQNSKIRYISVEDILVSNNRLIVAQNTGLSEKKYRMNVVGFDAAGGSKVFDYETYDGTSTPIYNAMKFEDNGDLLLSGTYEDKDYINDINYDGVYILKLSNEGKKLMFTKVSYKEKIQEIMKATSRSKGLGSKDKLFLEDVVHEGGAYYIVGEMFKKNIQASNLGGAFALAQGIRDLVTGKYIGWDNSSTNAPTYTFEIMDYIVIKFDEQGQYVSTKPLMKEKYNKISVYHPYNNMGGLRLARTMRYFGWFDYGFTTQNTVDGKNIMVCSDQSTNKPDVYFYELENQYRKNTVDLKNRAKVLLDGDAKVNYFRVLKNEGENIVVVYYQRKLKKASVTMEQITQTVRQ
jgi:hypothetical protein